MQKLRIANLSNFTIEIRLFNFVLKTLTDVNCRTCTGKLFHNTLPLYITKLFYKHDSVRVCGIANKYSFSLRI